MNTQTTTAPAYLVTTPAQYGIFFRWTTSRARDSYGYNVCSLLIDGQKVASCNGGGYDMEGTVLGQWINGMFAEQLRALAADRVALAEQAGTARYYDGGNEAKAEVDGQTIYLYGLTVWKNEGQTKVNVKCDGGTGKSQMQAILKALGFKWHSVQTGRNTWAYSIRNY